MIEVAAGVLVDAAGRVLLLQRLPGKHLAGLWEFPGGKLEAGESLEQALLRELYEELGIEVRACAPLISIPWRYPEKTVRLHALRVTRWAGVPRAREGHPLRWLALSQIDAATMPPADVPILAALRLPPYYAIRHAEPATSDPGVADAATNLSVSAAWAAADKQSNSLLQLRMPASPQDEVRGVACRWLAADSSLRPRLLLNQHIELARELGVGVQLKAAQLRQLDTRPLPASCWVGASCHNVEELELAAELGADFACLSPVLATASHPAAAPLGWDRFAQWVADARLPVYALGGVGPDDAPRARAAGAQGVAGIRGFASLPHPRAEPAASRR